MSETAPGTASNPLADAERVDARRYCGYPVYGPGASGFVGYRFFHAYGMLEYRLTNLTASELAVLRTYLTQLYPLETGILGAAANLDTAQAAVWTRNASEVRDRERLYDGWRKRLCSFLGVPPGPEFGGDSGGRIVI